MQKTHDQQNNILRYFAICLYLKYIGQHNTYLIVVTMQQNATNVINILLILQNVISASQDLANIEEIVITPALDTSVAAIIVILGTSARDVIAIMLL